MRKLWLWLKTLPLWIRQFAVGCNAKQDNYLCSRQMDLHVVHRARGLGGQLYRQWTEPGWTRS